MHLISFDASNRQLNKLRKGLPTRIKRGTGFNLIVNPNNYHLVSRAFGKNKGVELKLTPEELDFNAEVSPEEHEQLAEQTDASLFKPLPLAEGGSIFKKFKKALNSKTAKKIGRELKPVGRILKQVGKEMAHNKIADLHMNAIDNYGDDEHNARAINALTSYGHSKVGGKVGIGKKIARAFRSKTAKRIGRDMKPLSRELKQIGRDVAHEKLAEAHMNMADRYGDNEHAANAINSLSNYGHSRIGGNGLYAGAGIYAGRGMNVHDALKLANLATAKANHELAKMHNATVHGMLTQPPIRGYYNSDLEPPSRGSGIHSHLNIIRGRGSLLTQDNFLPPALQSQPYGANFHMQFFLPPQYKKYNNGTDVEGTGYHI